MNELEIIDKLIELIIKNQQTAKDKQSSSLLDNSAYAYHCGYEQALRDAIKQISEQPNQAIS